MAKRQLATIVAGAVFFLVVGYGLGLLTRGRPALAVATLLTVVVAGLVVWRF